MSGAATSFSVFCMINVERLSKPWLDLVFKFLATFINSSYMSVGGKSLLGSYRTRILSTLFVVELFDH